MFQLRKERIVEETIRQMLWFKRTDYIGTLICVKLAVEVFERINAVRVIPGKQPAILAA
jgi:hypothetical protein